MKYINRNIENTLINLANSFPVVMVTGPRQVGKSTLLEIALKEKIPNLNVISLDNLTLRENAINDPELFIRTHKPPLLIDEFQYAPELLNYIKIEVDKNRLDCLKNDNNPNGMYFLTGSQIFNTMENISESLAGRVGILKLFGLSNKELNYQVNDSFVPIFDELINKDKTEILDVYEIYNKILKGSFPELYNNTDINIENFYDSYFQTYIEKDIRKKIKEENELVFKKFVQALAARTSQELNILDICKDVGITTNTANSWLSLLINSGLVYLLQPYFSNKLSSIIKRPKLYFTDTGLCSYLTGYVDARTLEKGQLSGAIFENYVIMEIVKSYTNSGKDPSKYLSYYRDKNHKEIDLLITKNNTIYPIEIKKSSNPDIKAIKNFSILNNFDEEKGEGGVICLCSDITKIKDNYYRIPLELI